MSQRGDWHATGVDQHISVEWQARATQRLTDRYGEARKRGRHLWVVTTAFFVTPPLADGAHLDIENLAAPPLVGCYVCEQVYRDGDEHTRCPGDPI